MRSTCGRFIWFAVILAGWACEPAAAQLWKNFVPGARPNADAAGELALSEERGPWLVMASTFSGEGAETQARELAMELRERYDLAAYLHAMKFDFSDEQPGRGLDEYGGPVRTRYQRDEVQEFAVLVGNFPAVDDPDAQQLLERIKTMQPEALRVEEGEQSAQSLAQLREWQDQVMEKLGKKRDRGPMWRAFIIRNPLLPREYFVPKGVDSFVAKMNQGVEHSLLDCPGRYTIQIATFRGKTVLQTSAVHDDKGKSPFRWKRDEDNPLVEAAENAHLLCEELRSHGWEAYEFHDRTESMVTIGSFSQILQRLADGREVPTPQAQKIIQTFGAAYDTPSDPLSDVGNDLTTQRRVAEQTQQFSMKLQNQQAQVVPGMNPKHVKIWKGHGKNRKVTRIIPLDIHPKAIEAPKRSISGAYAG